MLEMFSGVYRGTAILRDQGPGAIYYRGRLFPLVVLASLYK
jgi:hypothetical protein